MGNMKENPRYNVVSIRLNDEEREALQDVCKETNKSASTLLREVMSQLCDKTEKPRVAQFDNIMARM